MPLPPQSWAEAAPCQSRLQTPNLVQGNVGRQGLGLPDPALTVPHPAGRGGWSQSPEVLGGTEALEAELQSGGRSHGRWRSEPWLWGVVWAGLRCPGTEPGQARLGAELQLCRWGRVQRGLEPGRTRGGGVPWVAESEPGQGTKRQGRRSSRGGHRSTQGRGRVQLFGGGASRRGGAIAARKQGQSRGGPGRRGGARAAR